MVFQILALFFLGLVSQQLVQGLAPDWGATTATATVAEDAAADTPVTLSGTTTVSQTPTSVEILSTSTTGSTDAFSVALNGDATDIVFKVKAAGVLDRETHATMTVIIRATNGDGTTADGNGDLDLTVTISDANDNAPEFLVKTGCIEKANAVPASTSVGIYTAIDLDDTANGLAASNPYALVGTSAKFDLNTASGEITVKSDQTLSSGGSWKLVVTAKDQGAAPLHTGTGTLTVCVGMGCCSGTVFIRGTVLGLVLTVLSYYLQISAIEDIITRYLLLTNIKAIIIYFYSRTDRLILMGIEQVGMFILENIKFIDRKDYKYLSQ